MRKYYVEHCIVEEIGTHYFFDTLQEAIDELDEAKGQTEGEMNGRRRRRRRNDFSPYGYGLVIDVPESEREDGEDDDDLINRLDILSSRYTSTECKEYEILSSHNYSF